jgi:nitrite reductase/ring-hydroxylating ferredoxin subunit
MAEFTRVADVSELPEPGKLLVEVDGDPVALFHIDGHFHAIDDVCTHDGGPLEPSSTFAPGQPFRCLRLGRPVPMT